jgi:hypothetical protein
VYANRIGDRVYLSLTVQHPHEHADEEEDGGVSEETVDKQRAWMVGGAQGSGGRQGPRGAVRWLRPASRRLPHSNLPLLRAPPPHPFPCPPRQGYVGPFPASVLEDNATLTFTELPLLSGPAANTVRATAEACLEPRGAVVAAGAAADGEPGPAAPGAAAAAAAAGAAPAARGAAVAAAAAVPLLLLQLLL